MMANRGDAAAIAGINFMILATARFAHRSR